MLNHPKLMEAYSSIDSLGPIPTKPVYLAQNKNIKELLGMEFVDCRLLRECSNIANYFCLLMSRLRKINSNSPFW